MYEEKSVTPVDFLASLRQKFPQFAQQGAGGLYMQQDAEECYSQVLNCFREKLDSASAAASSEENNKQVVKDLFGIEMETHLVSEESKEEVKEVVQEMDSHIKDGQIDLKEYKDKQMNSEQYKKAGDQA